MAKRPEINMNLPSVDDLFSTQEERDEASRESVRSILISDISDFPNHPFKVKLDECKQYSLQIKSQAEIFEL